MPARFADGHETEVAAIGLLFNPDGARREPFRFEVPPALVSPGRTAGATQKDWKSILDREQQLLAARKAHLTECTGFVPAFIRVEKFKIEGLDGFCSPYRHLSHTEESWGQADHPDVSLEEDLRPGGFGSGAVSATRYTAGSGGSTSATTGGATVLAKSPRRDEPSLNTPLCWSSDSCRERPFTARETSRAWSADL